MSGSWEGILRHQSVVISSEKTQVLSLALPGDMEHNNKDLMIAWVLEGTWALALS